MEVHTSFGRAHLRIWGEGPPLLLLHGLGTSGRFWEATARLLAPRARLLAPDLPGHGASAPIPLGPREGVRWLLDLLDALGLPRVAVVGHSLGGFLALRLALEHPERVSRLVAVCPPGLGRRVGLPLRAMALPVAGAVVLALADRWPALALRALVHDVRALPQDGRQAVPEARRQARATVLGLLRRAVGPCGLRPSYRFAPWELARIDRPVLLVWGAEDRMIPLEQGLVGLACLPRARLAVLAACGHWPPVEAPEAFADLVVGFLGLERGW